MRVGLRAYGGRDVAVIDSWLLIELMPDPTAMAVLADMSAEPTVGERIMPSFARHFMFRSAYNGSPYSDVQHKDFQVRSRCASLLETVTEKDYPNASSIVVKSSLHSRRGF
jgi:hypothetical protein